MHSLEIIHKRNAEAMAAAVDNLARQGRHVVVTTQDGQVASFETFSDEGDAFVALGEPLPEGANRKLVPPRSAPSDFSIEPRANGDFNVNHS